MTDDDDPGFLRENWLWILVPALLVLGAAAWLLFSGGDDPGGFNYGGF